MRAALGLALWLAAQAAGADPALDYQLQCQGCHLADGSGAPGAVPSLAGVGRFLAASRGREYLVRVPGSAQAPLSSARLAALLDWLVRRFPADAGAPEPAPFDPAQVERWRQAPLTDVATLRAALLAEIRPSASGVPSAAAARAR